uniref:Uncharacterized protein n=1 Tax=Magallana gigas TaxID=29159 RepID=K1PN06_MAGGI
MLCTGVGTQLGKKVESMWICPGVIVEAKSDTVFAVKSRREVNVMHHDKLKKCDARKLPKWLVDYMRSRQSKSPSDMGDHLDDEVSANLLPKSLPILPLRRDLGNSLMDHSGVQCLIFKVLLSMMKLLSQNRQSGDRKGTEV